MRQRPFILVAVVVGLLVAGVVGAWAYDSSRKTTIAKGVSAGGVDIGGMKTSEAKRALREQIAAPLSQPLVVKYGHRRFTLSARRAQLSTDVDGMVQEALDKSRGGNVITRAFRGITGGSVNESVPARVSYSKAAVSALVKRMKGTVDHKAQDATVSYSAGGLEKVPSRLGLAVRGRQLTRDVRAALVRPDAPRTVRAETKITKPQVTTDQLASKYPIFMIINRGARQLRLYKQLELARTYTIAVGRQGLETPAGLYHIQDKQVNPSWHVPNSSWAGSLAGKVIPPGPQDPIKARWLGFNGGAGIHGTADIASLGTAASHGCVRMSIPDVEQLYDQVSVGSPLYVA